MFTRKQELLSYIESLSAEYKIAVEAAPQLLDDANTRFEEQYHKLHQTLESGELLVPVVGGFSAGKSTAINGIIGDEILPVAVTAETAIPAELRYSHDEYILAQNINGNEERHPVSALTELSANAANYEVVKVFLNRQALKDIAPFTLVDMPGFDSALEQHNNAILRYLTRGAFYFYLVNAKDGTLRSQDIRRLHEVMDMGRNFSIFLTKKDLATESELAEVQAFINDQVAIDLATDVHVGCIDMDDASLLLKELAKADSNQVFNQLFISAVKDLYYMASADINSAISALKKSKDEGREQIATLQQALSSMMNERERNLRTIQSDSVVSVDRRIISRLESELNGSVNEFVSLAKAGNNALGRAISDLVRSSLVSELQKAIGQLSNEVIRNVSGSLNVTLDADFNFSDDWKQNLMSNLQTEVMSSLTSSVNNSAVSKGIGVGGASGILFGIGRFIPIPLLNIVLAILPGIVDQLFQGAREAREKERYAEAIRTQVIPSVLRQVAPEVSSALAQVSQSMVQAVTEQFEVKISQQQEILEKAQADSDASATDIEASVTALESVRKNINTMAESNII
ncbi:dynamin family protein [Oceanisphaera sp.]|uniref:dynamin family protein n=1 Tax=Oceanisphaera sp. TaxID=1929979 RepID=UPI003A938CE8